MNNEAWAHSQELTARAADGHFVANQAADGKVAVWNDATGACTSSFSSAIVASAVTCPGQTLVQEVGEAIFGAHPSSVGVLANVSSPCNGPVSPQAVHIFDIASSTDQSLTLPVRSESASGGMLEGGQALTASDTHEYFIAADGLCESAGP